MDKIVKVLATGALRPQLPLKKVLYICSKFLIKQTKFFVYDIFSEIE